MIIEYGTDAVKNEWLEFLIEDPVHPDISIDIRRSELKTVLALVDNNIPQAMICVKLGDKLP